MTNDINDIETDLKNLQGLKNTDRQNLINRIALNLYHYLKEKNYVIVEKDFLKTFFSEITNLRTQNQIFKEIIDSLISKNKIAITDKQKDRVRFMRKALLTFDYDSYNTLMSKNGYKTYLYKWGYDNKPIKRLLGKYPINNLNTDVLNYCDVVETKSNIKRKNQGVFSNKSLSIVKSNSKYKVKAYLIL